MHTNVLAAFAGASHLPGAFQYMCALLLSALQVAFGSLYRDDVLIKPSRVVAILAAACMLQLVSMPPLSDGTVPGISWCTPLNRSEILLFQSLKQNV